jgi:hypothetical protein
MSRKPDVLRERIERLVDGPYLELFARETKPGWDALGAEVGLLDCGTSKRAASPPGSAARRRAADARAPPHSKPAMDSRHSADDGGADGDGES